MLVTKEYNRDRALEYARRWALSRNPLYYDYTGIGGNCTNFVSQCVYAGSCTMNYTPIYGWYYLSVAERTASWTGVEYFYNFMTGNAGVGPFAREVPQGEAVPADVIQLGRTEGGYYHTLLITAVEEGDFLVAAQSDDALDRALSTYDYDYARFLHIEGVRLNMPDTGDCFASLLAGEAILPDIASVPPLPRPSEEMPAPPASPPTQTPEAPPAEEGTPPAAVAE